MANRNIEPVVGEIFVPGPEPSAPLEGQTYYDSTAHSLRVRGVSTWSSVSGNSSGTNTGDQTAATVPNTPAGGISAVTVQAAINELDTEKIAANTAIVAGTNTKISYDAKGLVTAGVAATTVDIADSTDRRYCTDAQKVVIGNTSGTNTGDMSIGTFGSTPNPYGGTITTGVLTFQPANGTNPGGVSIAAQSFAGYKTFVDGAEATAKYGTAYMGGASMSYSLWGVANSSYASVLGLNYGTGDGIKGESTGGKGGNFIGVTGVYGSGSSRGVEGGGAGMALYGAGGTHGCYASGSQYGVQASSDQYGGSFTTNSISNHPAVKGESTGVSGSNYGGLFTCVSGIGCAGQGSTYGGYFSASAGVGMYGASTGGTGYGVQGVGTVAGMKGECSAGDYGGHFSNTNTGTGTHYGIYASCDSTGSGDRVGVLGGGLTYGVYGTSTTGTGIYGTSGGSYGIYGDNTHVGAESAYGVYGHCTSTGGGVKCGVVGFGRSHGVMGSSIAGYGLFGEGNSVGAPLMLAGLAAAPSSTEAGQIYFNSADSHFYGYNGTTWKQLDN